MNETLSGSGVTAMPAGVLSMKLHKAANGVIIVKKLFLHAKLCVILCMCLGVLYASENAHFITRCHLP